MTTTGRMDLAARHGWSRKLVAPDGDAELIGYWEGFWAYYLRPAFDDKPARVYGITTTVAGGRKPINLGTEESFRANFGRMHRGVLL